MNKQLLIAFFVLFFIGCKDKTCNYITDYYLLVHKAEIHYLKNENQEALALLKQAECNCELLNQPGVYEPNMMAELLVRLGRKKEAIYYLELAIKKGMLFSQIDTNDEFLSLKNMLEWDAFKLKASRLEIDFQKQINHALRNQILQINAEDQMVRQGDIDFEAMKITDSINQDKIKQILKTYGYPNEALIGYSNGVGEYTDITVLFMHFQDIEYFKPILIEAIKKGEAAPRVYANMIDSKERSEGMYTYGIYQNIDSTRIKDFKNLDKRRTLIGLPPYKQKKEYDKLIRKKYGF